MSPNPSDPELVVALAYRLRDRRIRSGLKQREAAVAAGITQAALSNYERGLRAIPLHTAFRLAVMFGASLDALFDGVMT